MKTKNNFYILWLILMSLMIASLYGCNDCKPCRKIASIELDFSSEKYVLNIENVYAEIMRNNIMFSDIVLKQAILETGWLTSYNCRIRHNLFGMTGGNKSESNEHGYAIYDNWMESVKAYKLWQVERLTDGIDNYYQFLRDFNYAESEAYESKLKSIKLVIVKK